MKNFILILKRKFFLSGNFTWIVFLFFITVSSISCRISQFHISEKYSGAVKLNSDILIGPGECLLKTFQGTSVNNNFYVNWIFISNTKDFIFQLELSKDGKYFKPYCIKQGASSPNGNTALMLSVKDNMKNEDKLFFRLKAIPQNYILDNDYLKGYSSLIDASTIMIRRNKENQGFSILSNNN